MEEKFNSVSVNAPVTTCLMFIRRILTNVPKMNKPPYNHARQLMRILNDDSFLNFNTEADVERGDRKRITKIADYIDTIPKEQRQAIYIKELMKCIIDYYEKLAIYSSKMNVAHLNDPMKVYRREDEQSE